MNRQFFVTFLFLIIYTVILSDYGWSRSVKGVDFAEKISIDNHTLTLSGVGVRKKLIINVYLGALYLQNLTQNYDTIITSNQPKRIVLHFLYSEVKPEQLVEAWNEGFQKNSPDALINLRDRISEFNGWFTESVHKGATIAVTYIPGNGTEVMVNNTVKGTIPGEDFMRAVFAIWFGKHPPSNGLKEGMIGK